MKTIAQIFAISKINIKMITRYTSAVWANVFVNILQVAIFYHIWMAIYGENISINGISKSQMVTYIVLSRLIYINGIVSWGVNQWITDIIKDGQISIELLRPMDFQLLSYARRIGVLIFSMFLYGTPAVLIFVVFLDISYPSDFLTILLFIISFILAMSINFFVEFAIGLIGFFTNNGWGLQILKEGLFSFLSGALIPIVLMPGWMQPVINLLPFKDIIYTPLSIYLGIVDGKTGLHLILNQFYWVILLLILSRAMYNILIKKITVQGG